MLARDIVGRYCGEAAAESAERRYGEVASGGVPETMDAVTLRRGEIGIAELVRTAGLAGSNSDARRLIAGGGIKLNGVTVTDCALTVSGGDDLVLSRGKNRFVRVAFI
jgi:tyrosyl-tRNA synthetase